VGRATLFHGQHSFTRAWAEVQGLSDHDLARCLPVEAVDGALATGTAEARARARAVADQTDRLDVTTLVDLAGRFLVMGEEDTARSLAEAAQRRGTDGAAVLDERRVTSLALLTAWLAHPGHQVPEGAVPVAVIDYQSPDQDLASSNIGDYVQTLALLGNLARFTGVRFTGQDGLGELVSELQGQVRPDLRLPDPTAAVHLFELNRDFSSFDPVPEGTWMVAFGWHMHPLYELRYDFPYHPNVRPLFTSFHINRLGLLTEEAVDYLRAHGPVGCRDWTTVYLLLSAGVDAFFTGCLTSTVDAVFPPLAEVERTREVVGVIDLRAKAAGKVALPVEVHEHQTAEFRQMDFVTGVRRAQDVLTDYRRRFDHVVTRRLHAYLPLIALGVPVTFQPAVQGDVRFPGLSGLTPGDPDLRRMQDEIRRLLGTTLAAAFAGASQDEVYALWRELTADAVATAKARFNEPVEDAPTTLDVASIVTAGWSAHGRFGPPERVGPDVTDVVLCFDQNLTAQTPVMLESLVANASGPLRLWVVSRGLEEPYQKWLAEAFPTVPMTFLPFDHVAYGTVGRVPGRITISTMDRLLLPELLTDVDRVLYIDIDTLVLGDVCELFRTDLGGAPLAARDSVVSGVGEWRNVGKHLSEVKSLEVQRRLGAQHGFTYEALNAGVLLLDLRRMRLDRFTATYLGWVQQYGLNDQDVMLAYSGPDRLVLDPSWNALPYLEAVRDPKIIHWAAGGKPWWAQLAPYQDIWREYDVRLRARVGAPPEQHEPPPGQHPR
ncbi:MAG: hypothetical protein M3P23_13200, partial [Actinomycetota bacterium]|nr:hypothetical protein [Actinomycetota bacterium]